MNNLTLKKIPNKQNVARQKIQKKPKENLINLHENRIIIIFINQKETITIIETIITEILINPTPILQIPKQIKKIQKI